MKRGFNLLKAQAEPPSVWTAIYDWVLGTARIVIIVVEVIVLIAFGIRVVVDLQASELDKKIERAETFVEFVATNEAQFRMIQAKTTSYNTIWNSTPDYTNILASINAALPINSSISDLVVSVQDDSLTINGIAEKQNEADIVALETSLKNSLPFLRNSTLEKLENSSNQLTFSFRATIVNIPNKDLSDITIENAN